MDAPLFWLPFWPSFLFTSSPSLASSSWRTTSVWRWTAFLRQVWTFTFLNPTYKRCLLSCPESELLFSFQVFLFFQIYNVKRYFCILHQKVKHLKILGCTVVSSANMLIFPLYIYFIFIWISFLKTQHNQHISPRLCVHRHVLLAQCTVWEMELCHTAPMVWKTTCLHMCTCCITWWPCRPVFCWIEQARRSTGGLCNRLSSHLSICSRGGELR